MSTNLTLARRRALHVNGGPQRRAAAAVEAALVLPVLGLIVFACTDLGRVIHAQIALTNAVRVGAEYGATHRFVSTRRSAWEAQVRSATLEELSHARDLSTDTADVQIDVAEDGNGNVDITVAVESGADLIVPWPGFPPSIELFHAVTMRQYR